MGEWIFGTGKGLKNLAYITLSSGVGGGVIVDNVLLIGKDGNAAEIGHMVIDFEGRLACNCGGRGHWEAYCSGAGIIWRASVSRPEARQISGREQAG